MMRATSVCGRIRIHVIHIEEAIVGNVGLARRTFYARACDRDGMDAEFHVDALLGEDS